MPTSREQLTEIKNRIEQLTKGNMNTKDLISLKPYSIGRVNSQQNTADIIFQDEGVMTVPKSTAQTIVNILNAAFTNGVKMTIKNLSSTQFDSSESTPITKSKNNIPEEVPWTPK